ncbi:di-heme-cytochrome C peroxidase [Azospirillum sp.]|uniref:di-heme-cytochrome C peroxidase n=1 Tax=Azospirillum sp. TaxID=34012 RepID=UPI003D73B4D0
MVFRTIMGVGVAVGLLAATAAHAQDAAAQSNAQKPNAQGWTPAQQAQYYTEDQGSRMIPLRWLQALKQRDRKTPFLADSLQRYGYLPNMASAVAGLPVGFNATNGNRNDSVIGMTCAACHTRDLRINGQTLRIDGGPAITDFFAFMVDLDDAVTYALGPGWVEFAQAVPEPRNKAQLRKQVLEWAIPFHTLMSKALTGTPWGLARLDAVSMIYNRLTGLDLGPKQANYLIPENIQPAIAPVRYPFLWNAGRQNKTQWPGFTDQTSVLAPLGRNIGEVFGVFGQFNPVKSEWHPILGVNYWNNNSVQMTGLKILEDLITTLKPPPFPGAIDQTKVNRGLQLYNAECLGCHALPTGTARASWNTPIQNVGTDGTEWLVLPRTANPGVLTGASLPKELDPTSAPLANPSPSIAILQTSVMGSILQHLLPALQPTDVSLKNVDADALNTMQFFKNRGIDAQTATAAAATANAADKPQSSGTFCDVGYSPPCYESRVLYGIWSAAPYLHNGSVPTLWDLLTPAAQRPATFEIGADYDAVNVGLAKTQTGLKTVMKTTGCEDLKSGNSRCGHEFGTTLSDADKWALVEFLKGL